MPTQFTPAEDARLDEAVDEAMETIRSTDLMDDGVPAYMSIAFLTQLAERCEELAAEIVVETRKKPKAQKVVPAPPAAAPPELPPAEPDSERTQLADHLMAKAKDRREHGE